MGVELEEPAQLGDVFIQQVDAVLERQPVLALFFRFHLNKKIKRKMISFPNQRRGLQPSTAHSQKGSPTLLGRDPNYPHCSPSVTFETIFH